MPKPVISPVYASQINRALQSARACALLERGDGQRYKVLDAIVKTQVRVGDWEGAYREVISGEGAATGETDVFQTWMLSTMALAQASLGDGPGALSTIRQGLGLGLCASHFFDTFCGIARIAGENADDMTAHEAVGLAEQAFTAHPVNGKTEAGRSVDYRRVTSLAEAQARVGRRDQADQTIQSALDLVTSKSFDGYCRRQEVVDGAYSHIASVQARIGDLPGALNTLGKMSDHGGIESGMSMIASVLASKGDIPGALSFVAQIKEVEPKTGALIAIAEAQARHGDPLGAQATLAWIERRELSPDTGWRFYSALAQVQRDRDNAPPVLAKILRDVNQTHSPWEPKIVYETVGEAYAAIGLVEEALRIFERISSRHATHGDDVFPPGLGLVREITKANTVAGNVEVAEAWIQTLPSTRQQCYAWLGIVDGCIALS